MGQLDQYAKQIFAEETELATRGAARFQDPVEINLSEVRLDGMLVVRDASRLRDLAAPWCQAGELDEAVLEVKMQGDHLNMPAIQRGPLRRQARQVQRSEDAGISGDGEVALWFVASRVPKVLAEKRVVERVAPGCYSVGPSPFSFLWIAANELPLTDELIPFLIARSGLGLDEFCLWVKTRKPPEWVARMVEFLPMTAAVYDELIRWVSTKTDDPVMNDRKRRAVRVLVSDTPEVRAELIEEGALTNAREALRRVLARRKLVVSAEHEARIAACANLATLGRWLDQAVDAESAAEALR